MQLGFKRIIFMGFLLCIPIFSNATVSCTDQRLKKRILNFMGKFHIPGAAVVIANHGKLRTCLFGEAVPKKHVPVSEKTIFELGSITKTFTGLILAKEVISGKIRLDQAIHPDLKIPHSANIGKISYLDLASYTSGLAFNVENLAYNASSSSQNQIKFRNYLKHYVPPFKPKSYMLYSNVGFGLLGQILAKNEQTSLTELMRIEILSPLNMNSSGLDLSDENQKYLAQGFTEHGKPIPYHPSGLFGGSWAMRASVKDIRSYLNAALGERSTPIKIHQAMLLTQTAYYDMPHEETQLGLGWLITPLNKASAIQKLTHQPAHYQFIPYQIKKIKKSEFNPNALIGKTGATDGFRAYLAVIPAKGTGIAIMINRFTPSSGALINLANKILLEESHIAF
ncbi:MULTISPECIES: serine hydrolase [Legionella]|uniref:AMPC cephalosporinase n=1 Tax=Legionella drozanskii LLAP-1 TaxID=1212489 RepID=A0A0W0SW84_9GAMM|nr:MULTISPECIES: serine hydrolase [Legionella]KTC87622.1 AMPC cephalosporinase [Legionella drozanskii LLAP-1]PJE12446.1 MAG: hypothetical protein CK430_07550 [Legionella sp.]